MFLLSERTEANAEIKRLRCIKRLYEFSAIPLSDGTDKSENKDAAHQNNDSTSDKILRVPTSKHNRKILLWKRRELSLVF